MKRTSADSSSVHLPRLYSFGFDLDVGAGGDDSGELEGRADVSAGWAGEAVRSSQLRAALLSVRERLTRR